MEILGKVKGGVVVLEDANALPDGTTVRVEPVEEAEPHVQEEGPTIWEKLLRLAGTAKGLPPDLAHNHDHYLHGLPKK